MTADDSHRHMAVERTGAGRFSAANSRGGTVTVGNGGDSAFTPVELLLTALAACTAIDVDVVTSRRAEPTEFRVEADAEKVRDADGSHLTGLVITFRATFPDGPDGDSARAVLPDMVRKSHERLCTVGRTIELGSPITALIV